jgi:hypothetical protein
MEEQILAYSERNNILYSLFVPGKISKIVSSVKKKEILETNSSYTQYLHDIKYTFN